MKAQPLDPRVVKLHQEEWEPHPQTDMGHVLRSGEY